MPITKRITNKRKRSYATKRRKTPNNNMTRTRKRSKTLVHLSLSSLQLPRSLDEHVHWRRALLEYIDEHAIAVDRCDLGTGSDHLFESLKVLQKDSRSASQTVIALGRLSITGAEVMAKISFEHLPSPGVPRDNSLEVEYQIYRITNSLFLNDNTPHTMLMLGRLTCFNFTEEMKKSLQNDSPAHIRAIEDTLKILEKRSKRSQSLYDLNKAQILLMERGGCDKNDCRSSDSRVSGSSLFEFLSEIQQQSNPCSWKYCLQPIIFQLVWTLACYRRVGIAHNDLHLGNIWIDTYPKPRTFIYTMSENVRGEQKHRTWVIKGRHVLKLFDFDRGSKRATSVDSTQLRNNKLTDAVCKRSFSCNEGNDLMDFFSSLHRIWTLIKYMYPQSQLFAEFEKWLFQVNSYINYGDVAKQKLQRGEELYGSKTPEETVWEHFCDNTSPFITCHHNAPDRLQLPQNVTVYRLPE